ncbi:putative multidrug resistance pump domain protein [Mycobacterium ulcerans str. Harvey]|uniref:Multidrug resistance pump domain protein n=1 Tax=Mycobacterium ulcerans str. Harvey TaxID=1299332 RepID=A0ABP3AEM9_MYCUL|nr:putative multidrug resistance pump domain protein [Mycobacterium ulcerans str. Harvey]
MWLTDHLTKDWLKGRLTTGICSSTKRSTTPTSVFSKTLTSSPRAPGNT